MPLKHGYGFPTTKKALTSVLLICCNKHTQKKPPEGWLSWMSPDCLLQHGIRLSNFQVQISAPQTDIAGLCITLYMSNHMNRHISLLLTVFLLHQRKEYIHWKRHMQTWAYRLQTSRLIAGWERKKKSVRTLGSFCHSGKVTGSHV